jgi:hypothetical protein
MDDAPAAAPSVPKSRKKVVSTKTPFIPPASGGSDVHPIAGDD